MRGPRIARISLLVFGAALTPLAIASAQARPRIEIRLPVASPASAPRGLDPDTNAPAADPPPSPPPAGAAANPRIRGVDLLSDGQTRDLLRNGFPARLHFRLDLWLASGVFNQREGTREWDVVVRYEPLAKRYRGARIVNSQVSLLGDFGNVADLANALAAPVEIPLVPMHQGAHYYYNAVVDIEMLSLRDLDEVEHWLRGDLQPAIRGKRNAGTAVGNGLRTLFLRLIGGEHRHYEARSKTFTA